MTEAVRSRLTSANVIATAALCLAVGGGGFALGASSAKDPTITACVGRQKQLLLADRNGKCKKGQKKLAWNQRGVQGVQGTSGAQGVPGPMGQQGPAGSPDTPQQVLAKLSQVDGTGSGLDAAVLDGHDTAFFQQRGSTTTCTGTNKATSLGANGNLTCAADQGAPATGNDNATATPSAAGLTLLFLNYASPTAVTDVLGGIPGQRVTLVALNGNVSIAKNATFLLTANWTPNGVGDTLTLIKPNTPQNWIEVARSDN